MSKIYKRFTLIGKLGMALACLFLLNSCEEIRYIDEADLPKIKPGGIITLQGVTPDGKKFNFKSECALLGIRELPNRSEVGFGPQKLYKGNFQTIGKSENLIIDFNFNTEETYLYQPDFDCTITNLTGSFNLGNRAYSIEEVFQNKLDTRTFVTNLISPGKPINFELTSVSRSNPPADTFKIIVESILLP